MKKRKVILTEAERRTVVAKGWGFGVRNRERLAKCSVVR